MTYQNLRDDEGDSLDASALSSDLSAGISNGISTGLPPGQDRLPGWLSGSRGLTIGLGLGLGLALVVGRLNPSQTSPADPPVPAATEVSSASVTATRAQAAPIRQTISTSGTVEAFDMLSVAPRANGLQILTVNVREGDRVSAGQVLATLDDSVLRAQLEQAQAQVRAAEAEVAQERAQTAQSEASLAEARDQLSRYESLFAQGAISEEELTSRRTQVATAEQAVGSATAAIESAMATVRSREAEVSRLSAQLSQTQVLAPASGIVATKSATVGASASTGTPLFEVINGEQLELAVKIPQPQLAQVRLGAPVQIRSDSDPNLQLQGTVRDIDPTVDPQTRQATVNVSLPGSDRLRPGMFLNAAIVTGSRQGVTVPAEAVLPQSDGGFIVYALTADGTVSAKPVDVGDRLPAENGRPAKVEITSGLAADTQVVVEGASYLQDGDPVKVVQ